MRDRHIWARCPSTLPGMSRRLPSLQALLCFEAAARHGSYTRAAVEVALTQGAVSRQVASLERQLGVALFKRTRHGMVLTAEGDAYARQVALRLQGLERDTQDVMARQTSGGAVQLAAVPSFATQWLIPRLPRLAESAPQVTVHIETRTRPFLFAESEFDAALYAGSPEQLRHWPGTRADMLMPEVVRPVASPALLADRKRWRPQDLARLPLLQQSTRPQAWQRWFEAMGVRDGSPLAGPRYELFSMLAKAAASGMGLALIPTMLIERELAQGELCVACERTVPSERAYYLVTPEGDGERPAVSRLRHWLLDEARESAAA